MEHIYNPSNFNVGTLQQVFKDINKGRSERYWTVYGTPEFFDRLEKEMCLSVEYKVDEVIEFPISYFLNGKETKNLKRRNKNKRRY